MEDFLLGMTLAHGRKNKIKCSIPHMPSQKSLKYSYLECPKAYLWFNYRINNNLILLIKNDLSTHNLWVVYNIEYIKL